MNRCGTNKWLSGISLHLDWITSKMTVTRFQGTERASPSTTFWASWLALDLLRNERTKLSFDGIAHFHNTNEYVWCHYTQNYSCTTQELHFYIKQWNFLHKCLQNQKKDGNILQKLYGCRNRTLKRHVNKEYKNDASVCTISSQWDPTRSNSMSPYCNIHMYMLELNHFGYQWHGTGQHRASSLSILLHPSIH